MANDDLIKQLEAKKIDVLNKAQSDIAQIDATIHTLMYLNSSYIVPVNGNVKSNLQDKYHTFNPKATVRDKVVFILKAENKFLHTRQIGNILHQLEPNMSLEDHISRLYTPIGQLKKDGKVFKYNVGKANINSFWGSTNWVTETGEIKEGYKYDEDQVKVQGSTDDIDI